jgi:hypothetical protein
VEKNLQRAQQGVPSLLEAQLEKRCGLRWFSHRQGMDPKMSNLERGKREESQ